MMFVLLEANEFVCLYVCLFVCSVVCLRVRQERLDWSVVESGGPMRSGLKRCAAGRGNRKETPLRPSRVGWGSCDWRLNGGGGGRV